MEFFFTSIRYCKIIIVLAITFFMTNACKTPSSDNDIKVINGIEAKDGQMVYVVRFQKGDSWCSGAFINNSIILTASHCVVDGSKFKKIAPYDISVGGIRSKTYLMASKDFIKVYKTAIAEKTDQAKLKMVARDLALIVFPRNTAQKLGIPMSSIKRIAKHAPSIGTEIYIMGFGRADDGDKYSSGVKRWGRNNISYVGPKILYYPSASRWNSVPGRNSGAAAGDSGGPLLDAATQTIIGVTSWSFGGFEYAPNIRSVYAIDLFAFSNQQGNEPIDY